MKPAYLHWVYFIRNFQKYYRNDELEFESFGELQFENKHYQALFIEIMLRQSICHAERHALRRQRLFEIHQELKRRGAR